MEDSQPAQKNGRSVKKNINSNTSVVESMQSHIILTMSHWSPGGYLCETGILLLALSRYISDPDVIDHHCGLFWGGPRPEPSLGLCANNVIIPVDLTQLSCPGFMLAAGLPSGFTTYGVGCWAGKPAISLHSHHVSLVQWTTCSLPVTRDPGSKPQGGTYLKPGFSC